MPNLSWASRMGRIHDEAQRKAREESELREWLSYIDKEVNRIDSGKVPSMDDDSN